MNLPVEHSAHKVNGNRTTDCDELDGRDYVAQSQPVKQVIEQWRVLFQNLLQHEPSILLFHHLDEAIPAEQTVCHAFSPMLFLMW